MMNIGRTKELYLLLDAVTIRGRGIGMFWLDHDVGE